MNDEIYIGQVVQGIDTITLQRRYYRFGGWENRFNEPPIAICSLTGELFFFNRPLTLHEMGVRQNLAQYNNIGI